MTKLTKTNKSKQKKKTQPVTTHQPALVAVDQSKVQQGRASSPRKQVQSKYTRWPCMDGEPIVTYLMVGKELYPYTAIMLKRREERLAELAKQPPQREPTLQEISQRLWDEL